jgi:quinoprotein relay system zinc metallohydrolase 2
MRQRLIQLVICSLFCWTATASNPSGDFIVEIASGVYVHQGRHASIESDEHDDIANLGFIVGQRCVAVIDSGGSVAIGARLKEAVRSVTAVPVCYVINTHIHFDHLLGNYAFISDQPSFIGHMNLPQAIVNNREFFINSFGADLGDPPTPDKIPDLTQTVEDSLELDLGGRRITLTAHGLAHTNNDLSVFDQKTATLFAGDLLFMERIPSLDGSIKGWLQRLDELSAIAAQRVVPGHGPASAPWPQASTDIKRYLQLLLDQVREAIADGQFMEQAMDTVGTSERDKWLLYDEVHRRNVLRAYKELEWE